MKLYSVSDEYIEFLRKKFPRVYSNINCNYRHSRKYLGAVIELNNWKYYIPLSSPKEHDYILDGGNRTIRNDSLVVIRIVCSKQGSQILRGTLQIGTMIPVPDSEITLYDISNETDKSYHRIIRDELIFIRKNQDKIIKTARLLYNKRKSGNTNNRVVNSCLDFSSVEVECDKWVELKKLGND